MVSKKNKQIAFRLLVCGLCALFWELALIRWLSINIRIIGYYSNFILISAFFGLGVGALLARYQVRLNRFIFPSIAISVLLGIYLSGFYHYNLSEGDFVWLGRPLGILQSANPGNNSSGILAPGLILIIAYFSVATVFIIFGQWIGNLFKLLNPLWAYSIEIFGSILGIFLFAIMSFLRFSPTIWFITGFILLFLIVDRKISNLIIGLIVSIAVITQVVNFDDRFVWSPYYRINFEKFNKVFDIKTKSEVEFTHPIGYQLTVNNDYHQMILNLTKGSNEHSFLKSWRSSYDHPYTEIDKLPPGPILIVGAGTGNDVSAALRNTDRRIFAVEIDPVILELGQNYHFEKPYDNSRVIKIVDDARSFFHKTDIKFALVVFGFLDSHTLLSNFSSVRLDNFVYTLESFEQVKSILLPGGDVFITFASNTPWIHERIVALLDKVFDYRTEIFREPIGYSNGIVYQNGKSLKNSLRIKEVGGKNSNTNTNIPKDDWPFLYLKKRFIPNHYIFFIVLMIASAYLSLNVLPKTQRKIRLPYFFLGAAFFLIETSNVVSLSLLFGSTWYVNVIVFIGILVLILLGNLTTWFVKKPRINIFFILLVLSIVSSIIVSRSVLLAIHSPFLRGFWAIIIFLGPIYFASLIFATLIKNEKNLYQAYGSNILGAVVGGACEYLSLIFGFKFLIVLTLVFYFAAFIFLRKSQLNIL